MPLAVIKKNAAYNIFKIMKMNNEIIKKLIAVFCGIEIGIIISLVIYLTLIGYLLSGIVGYLLSIILPFNMESIVIYVNYFIVILINVSSIYFCLKILNEHYKLVRVVALIIPIIFIPIYLITNRQIDKNAAINKELTHIVSNPHIPIDYHVYKQQIQEKLITYADSAIRERNNIYMSLFMDNESVKCIEVDTLFLSPTNKFGLCLYSFLSDSTFYAQTAFFSIEKNNSPIVYSKGMTNRSFGKTRQNALIDLKYILFVDLKTRIKQCNTEDYQVEKVQVYSILHNQYWSESFKDDTINLKLYGGI